MSHINFIVIIQELNLECQSVIEATALLLQGVLEIAYVLSITIPTNPLAITLLCSFLRVEQWLHALVVGTLWFNQIDEIELVSCSSAGISDSEIIPLSISSSVVIILQDQIILIVSNFNSSSQVA